MRVEADVLNPNNELVPGMYADASIVLDEAKNVLMAPVEAIDRTEDSPRVFLVNREGHVELRDVKIGLEAGDRVEIASGVAADDLVVIGNRSQLKAGAVVSPKVMGPRSGAAEEAR